MSRNTVTPEQQAQKLGRAQRFRAIRDALGDTQPVFAERLTAAGRSLGLEVSYDVGDITTRENARKELEIEDYLIASAIDPDQRSMEWLAFGKKLTKGTKVGGRVARTGTA